jgi:hypothetical protein
MEDARKARMQREKAGTLGTEHIKRDVFSVDVRKRNSGNGGKDNKPIKRKEPPKAPPTKDSSRGNGSNGPTRQPTPPTSSKGTGAPGKSVGRHQILLPPRNAPLSSSKSTSTEPRTSGSTSFEHGVSEAIKPIINPVINPIAKPTETPTETHITQPSIIPSSVPDVTPIIKPIISPIIKPIISPIISYDEQTSEVSRTGSASKGKSTTQPRMRTEATLTGKYKKKEETQIIKHDVENLIKAQRLIKNQLGTLIY